MIKGVECKISLEIVYDIISCIDGYDKFDLRFNFVDIEIFMEL